MEKLDTQLIPDETESLWETVKGDFRQAGGLGLLGLTLTLAWMAFQWGWGNDILLPPIVARSFDAIDDGSTWLSGIGAVAAGVGAGSAFWGLTQTIDGLVVVSGLRFIPGVSARISRSLRRQGWIKPFDEISLGTRFLIAYLSGASALLLVDVFATGKPGLRRRRQMFAQAVLLAVAGAAIAIAVITAALAVGARIPATSNAAEFIVRYARNPLTWLVIYGTIIGGSALFKRLTTKNDAATSTS